MGEASLSTKGFQKYDLQPRVIKSKVQYMQFINNAWSCQNFIVMVSTADFDYLQLGKIEKCFLG